MYRLGLLTHLQNEHVPLKVPECLRDLRTMYEAATIDDVNDAYAQFQMDDDHVFTCVGTSGETGGTVVCTHERCSPTYLMQGTQDRWNVCVCIPCCLAPSGEDRSHRGGFGFMSDSTHAGPTAPARRPVVEGSDAVLAEQAALEAEMEAVGAPKAMDGKLLLSVMAAIQGSGLGQALGKVATQKEEDRS